MKKITITILAFFLFSLTFLALPVNSLVYARHAVTNNRVLVERIRDGKLFWLPPYLVTRLPRLFRLYIPPTPTPSPTPTPTPQPTAEPTFSPTSTPTPQGGHITVTIGGNPVSPGSFSSPSPSPSSQVGATVTVTTGNAGNGAESNNSVTYTPGGNTATVESSSSQ